MSKPKKLSKAELERIKKKEQLQFKEWATKALEAILYPFLRDTDMRMQRAAGIKYSKIVQLNNEFVNREIWKFMESVLKAY